MGPIRWVLWLWALLLATLSTLAASTVYYSFNLAEEVSSEVVSYAAEQAKELKSIEDLF